MLEERKHRQVPDRIKRMACYVTESVKTFPIRAQATNELKYIV